MPRFVLVVSALTLMVTGPIIQGVANGIAVFINWLVHASGWVGGFIIGGFYQVLVIFGLHWGVVPLVAQQIAGTGESALNAIICSSMIAQGAAVLAVAIKSKKEDFMAGIQLYLYFLFPVFSFLSMNDFIKVFQQHIKGCLCSVCPIGFLAVSVDA